MAPGQEFDNTALDAFMLHIFAIKTTVFAVNEKVNKTLENITLTKPKSFRYKG